LLIRDSYAGASIFGKKNFSQRAQRRKDIKEYEASKKSLRLYPENKSYSKTLRVLKKALRLCVLCVIIYINSSVACLFVTVMQEQVSL
jgi:hypothetical protein